MKILLAPDKFKGTIPAPRVAEIEAEAVRSVFPDAEIICVPLADGGEGTVATLTPAMHGSFRTVSVKDPLGRTVSAVYGYSEKTAVLEMSAASGMVLLTPQERNPLKTSTFGTGEMIRSALRSGAEELVIGIGGSATVDGGTGMAEALGYRFYDANGKQISNLCGEKLIRIARIDGTEAESLLRRGRIRIASDVTNPLLGSDGAVAVFAAQKGATPDMMPVLEDGLRNLAEVLIRQGMAESADQSGDGAAGGLGFGLRAFCRAHPESGARLAIALTGFGRKLEGADYVVTGEGCTDSQTEKGKLCSEVARFCRVRGVPCILLSGMVNGDPGELFAKVRSASVPGTLFEEIRPHAEKILYAAAVKLAKEMVI